MARRGVGVIADTIDSFWRICGAIGLETLGLIVWNIGTRPPQTLAADMRRALRDPRALLYGLLRFFAGLGLVVAGALILLPTLPDPMNEFVPLEIFTLVAALICEVLVGNDVRKLVGKT